MAYGSAIVQNAMGNVPRVSRLVEHAINETDRAVGRVNECIALVRQTADRIGGSMPENKVATERPPVPHTCEGDNLNTALANLHAHLDTLNEQIGRLEGI
jgi:hypothetical protein